MLETLDTIQYITVFFWIAYGAYGDCLDFIYVDGGIYAGVA